jgi:hypothetical protein
MKEIDRVIKQELYYYKFNYTSVSNAKEKLENLYDYLLKQILKTETKPLNRLQYAALFNEVKQEIYNIYYTMGKIGQEELTKQTETFLKIESLAVLESALNKNIVNKIIDFDEKIFGYTFEDMIKSTSKTIVNKTKKVLDTMVLAGENERAAEKELKKVLVSNSTAMNKTIFRTYSKHLREKTREEVENHLEKQLGWISLSTLDSRTSAICIKYDQETFLYPEFSSRKDIDNKPPRHFNCRSILVRLTDETLSFTRQSKGDEGGKQVYSKTTFDDFLKRNPDTAKKLLGEEKYNLYLKGRKEGLKIDDFISEDGKFYTNEEIETLLLD